MTRGRSVVFCGYLLKVQKSWLLMGKIIEVLKCKVMWEWSIWFVWKIGYCNQIVELKRTLVNTMLVDEWHAYQILLALWGELIPGQFHMHIVLVQLFVSCGVSTVNNSTARRIASSSDAVTELTKQDTNHCTNTFMLMAYGIIQITTLLTYIGIFPFLNQ